MKAKICDATQLKYKLEAKDVDMKDLKTLNTLRVIKTGVLKYKSGFIAQYTESELFTTDHAY